MLPKIDTPIYELTLPIKKEKIKFRPFLVKEQKLVLMAVGSDDPVFTLDNIKQIIKNCSITKINVNDLSILDIQYFFIHLRARSVGELVDVSYRCKNDVDEGVCGNIMKSKVNLLEIGINESNYIDTIQITDTIGIKMKFPDTDSLKSISDNEKDSLVNVIYSCIDYIYDQESLYYAKDTPKEELIEWIESLNMNQMSKIEKFFSSLPVLKKDIDITCHKCGYQHYISIEGLESFLG